jgi:hypothetical protein
VFDITLLEIAVVALGFTITFSSPFFIRVWIMVDIQTVKVVPEEDNWTLMVMSPSHEHNHLSNAKPAKGRGG